MWYLAHESDPYSQCHCCVLVPWFEISGQLWQDTTKGIEKLLTSDISGKEYNAEHKQQTENEHGIWYHNAHESSWKLRTVGKRQCLLQTSTLTNGTLEVGTKWKEQSVHRSSKRDEKTLWPPTRLNPQQKRASHHRHCTHLFGLVSCNLASKM